MPSAVNMQQLPSTALMSPFGQTGFADSGYMAAANDNLNTLMALYTNSMNTNRNAAQQADGVVGDALTEGIGIGTGFLETMFPGTFGSPMFSGQKVGSTIMNSSGYTPYGRTYSNYMGNP